jgi:GNAT superfamily N-acetyltransferase
VNTEPVVRDARHDDVVAICRFGEAHVRPHYAPLIGAAAADDQVRLWWNETHLGAAVAGGLVVVAEADGQLVGVGQRGRRGPDHVIYKLYLHPRYRGRGLGPRLLAALAGQLPANADRLYIEHFVGNERAGAFYEREGFTVERTEPSPTGDPALGVMWRARTFAKTPGQASHSRGTSGTGPASSSGAAGA